MAKISTHLALALCATSLITLSACDKGKDDDKPEGRTVKMKVGDKPVGGDGDAVTATVATFDPNADSVLDLDAYGSELPDEYAIQQAFYATFGNLDQCVLDYKEAKKVNKQLKGDASVAIKLSGHKGALAVNAALPKKYDANEKLKDCVRESAAQAPYPRWDGPPRVVEFEFELDPGTMWVEE